MSELVVADKFRKFRVGGGYSDANPQELRKGMKVLRSYVEEVNENTNQNGVFFVIDEKATAENHAIRKENQERRKQEADLKNVSSAEIIKALVSNKKDEKKDIELPDGEPDETWTQVQLKQYCKENDIKFVKNPSAEALLELIKNA